VLQHGSPAAKLCAAHDLFPPHCDFICAGTLEAHWFPALLLGKGRIGGDIDVQAQIFQSPDESGAQFSVAGQNAAGERRKAVRSRGTGKGAAMRKHAACRGIYSHIRLAGLRRRPPYFRRRGPLQSGRAANGSCPCVPQPSLYPLYGACFFRNGRVGQGNVKQAKSQSTDGGRSSYSKYKITCAKE
jgi:hypothetical protein